MATARAMVALDSASRNRQPNEMGRIPILEYHLIGTREGRWEREHTRFRRDLELLYERGYRPITVAELVDKRINLPRGLSPVVFTFDDASPSQFRYIERDGELVIDSTSAVGIWLDFQKAHPDWESKATFCMLSGAEAGRAFFGDRNIEGQKTAWRHAKLKFLAERGFELCNHTLWHAQLSKYEDAMVQEQIARLALAVDSAVPGYRVRTLALPLGLWPKNEALAAKGSWTDARSRRTIAYDHAAVLLVAGEPVPSPFDPAFNALKLERVQIVGNSLERTLDWLEKPGRRYVSDGDARTVASPRVLVANASADGRAPSAP
ncbi:MAG TPA: polysaccharide deacetylase family protein [Gemmatimonadaceae bacterium]|nr:polysaccharide deacetylase family protein [Gemmatimonadaceae bacterium]